ncbi:MAG: DUF4367 domain-containing protein [Defluviitaleaceae bacterium]|nr:DUF4367 domain-containing protein [Defluviitaleaceae bacterium]
MRQEDLVKKFIKEHGRTDFSSESKNKAANLVALQTKLPILNEERENYMNERRVRVRKPVVIAACLVLILSMSAVVFGQDVINYFRNITLGEHVNFELIPEGQHFVRGPELTEEEIQNMIDAGELERITSYSWDSWTQPDWLTFTDIYEGKSHFITDVMLPANLPDGFELDHIHFFVETLEELSQYGANMFMSAVFSDGTNEFSLSIRYVTEETGFMMTASPNIREIEIGGHEAIIDDNILSLLIDDVLYMFLSQGQLTDAELIAMAESLQ